MTLSLRTLPQRSGAYAAPLSPDSVGLVTPQILQFEEPLALDCGRSLAEYELVYETYGTLNADHSNAVLICHALSSDHHAAGCHEGTDPNKPGWWDNCIGPGKPFDTREFFVVCCNNLGGCKGSTGPTSINLKTASPTARIFPSSPSRTGCAARPAWPTGSASGSGRR